MIVVDVGCANHGIDSIAPLLERFQPSVLYGFDPNVEDAVYEQDGARVELSHLAAWVHDGTVAFRPDRSASQVDQDGNEVHCFNFAAWLEALLEKDEVVVKLDCEGSEFALIAAMRHWRQLDRLKMLLVEWHFPCHVEAWDL